MSSWLHTEEVLFVIFPFPNSVSCLYERVWDCSQKEGAVVSSKAATKGALGPCGFQSVCSGNAPLLFPFKSFREHRTFIGYLWHISQAERCIWWPPFSNPQSSPSFPGLPCLSWVRARHRPIPGRSGLRADVSSQPFAAVLWFCFFQDLISDRSQKVKLTNLVNGSLTIC